MASMMHVIDEAVDSEGGGADNLYAPVQKKKAFHFEDIFFSPFCAGTDTCD